MRGIISIMANGLNKERGVLLWVELMSVHRPIEKVTPQAIGLVIPSKHAGVSAAVNSLRKCGVQ